MELTKQFDVGIVMGSDSDLPVMIEAHKVLNELGISSLVEIKSAHRTPEAMIDYARTAFDRQIKVIIAGAGGAAHLPGMIASETEIPVIGVPIKTSTLNGIDSLYSIVQMPPNIPVATMAINGARNAGILAAKILAISNPDIAAKLKKFREGLKDSVIEKNNMLLSMGPEAYLEQMKK